MTGKVYYTDMEKSELAVAKYLNEMDFDWNYETPVFVFDEKNRPRVWTPDFYLPAFQMYIEVCGSKDFSPVEHVKNNIFCVGALNPKKRSFV